MGLIWNPVEKILSFQRDENLEQVNRLFLPSSHFEIGCEATTRL